MPSRVVGTFRAFISVSLSMVRLERISWKMPMAVLAMAMPRNSMSPKEPTSIRRTASTTKIRLKNVRHFSRMIWPSVLVGDSTGVLVRPLRCRSRTSCALSPAV